MEVRQSSNTRLESHHTLSDKVAGVGLYRGCNNVPNIMEWLEQIIFQHEQVRVDFLPQIFLRVLIDFSLVRYYCWGPAKPPMDMSPNEQARWHAHMQTPVLFNHHAPIEVESQSIKHVDLNTITSTPRAIVNEERVLILTPLKDASPYLNKYFDLLSELTYPHDLIDLAFLISDSSDDTLAVLSSELDRLQKQTDKKIPFHSALIVEKNFGVVGGVANVAERHAFAAQGPRRKAIARARNYLLYTALKPEHSWVYWRDVDIQDSPSKILEDFMDHNKDILVPSTSPRSRIISICTWLKKGRHLVS